MNRATRILSQHLALVLAVLCMPWSHAMHATPVETYDIYRDGFPNGHEPLAWNIKLEERIGGVTASGKYLALNSDWLAKPWSGMRFVNGKPLTITQDWYDKGFIRIRANRTVNRYGEPNGELAFQLFLMNGTSQLRREIVRPIHIQRGRGLDEDPGTWQEIMFPLSSIRALKVGEVVDGFKFQVQRQTELAFGLDEIAFVRFDELPQWFIDQRNTPVLQPDVEWPEASDLPDALRTDLNPIRVEDGKFVGADGQRVFMLNPYTREVSEFDLWGGPSKAQAPPPLGLFSAESHDWLYNDLLNGERLSRLGFNSLSVTMPPEPWYRQLEVGFDTLSENSSLRLGLVPPLDEMVDRVKVPLHVDVVCWPWSLGKPAVDKLLPEEVLTQGRHHWVYWRIIGPGRQLWLDMWRLYAQRYADAGANVMTFELMNEPAYLAQTVDHLAEFEAWLGQRFDSVAEMNELWKTDFTSFADAAHRQDTHFQPAYPGRWFDYEEYLVERFQELTEDGAELVNSILPDTLVGVQPMGIYMLTPHEAIWKYRLVEAESVVITPTGGGSWTTGSGAGSPTASTLQTPMADAPWSNDMLLAVADNKMIIDNEFSLEGQGRDDTFNKLWEAVITGHDGVSIFNWAKRGWSWSEGRNKVEMLAERFPYTALNPAARRTESLRGIFDFTESIQPIAGKVLPKPWGPDAKIAYVFSWDDARRRVLEPNRLDKRGAYYAALKYSHWNMAMAPVHHVLEEDALAGYDVAVLASVTHAEPGLPAALDRFVRRGGVLIVGEKTFDRTLYDHELDTLNLLGFEPGGASDRPAGELDLGPLAQAIPIRGAAKAVMPARQLALSADVAVVVRDVEGKPIVTRHAVGDGFVYFQAADITGYTLAKVMWAILADAAQQKGHDRVPDAWRTAEVTDTRTDELAPNVLLSRRSHDADGRHALLLLNRDSFDKTIQLRVTLDDGTYRVAAAVGISEQDAAALPQSIDAGALAAEGLTFTLKADAPAVILLER
ncbi:MAG: hypothetical protein AAF797_00625 [Planctomycetota bacterium]